MACSCWSAATLVSRWLIGPHIVQIYTPVLTRAGIKHRGHIMSVNRSHYVRNLVLRGVSAA